MSVVVLLAGLALAACAGETPESPLPADLARALESTSEFQREILKDGNVTHEEYERAVYATVQCMRDGGIRISQEPYETWRGQLDFAWETRNEEEDALSARVHEECRAEHNDLVSIQYFYQVRPTEKERAEARIALIECLRSAGVQLSSDPTGEEFRALATTANASFRTCRAEVVEEFDFSDGWLPG